MTTHDRITPFYLVKKHKNSAHESDTQRSKCRNNLTCGLLTQLVLTPYRVFFHCTPLVEGDVECVGERYVFKTHERRT